MLDDDLLIITKDDLHSVDGTNVVKDDLRWGAYPSQQRIKLKPRGFQTLMRTQFE